MSTRGIGAPDASHSAPVVPAGQEPFADVADVIEAEHTVLGSVPLIVDVAELLEMPVEDRVQPIATPGNVASLGGNRGRSSSGLHTLQDGRKVRRDSLCRLARNITKPSSRKLHYI